MVMISETLLPEGPACARALDGGDEGTRIDAETAAPTAEMAGAGREGTTSAAFRACKIVSARN